MLWKEITFTLSFNKLELFESHLLELGACSITLKDAKDQPILEPAVNETPLWDDILLTALFTEEYDLSLILNQLSEEIKPEALPFHTTKTYPDKDWERTWMEHFKPIKLGKRLWICPSWQKPPEPDAINILLDPGLAFGSGSHPTTELCLRFLDENVEHNETVLDFGCGSGILAISAIKLGAKKAHGIDIDPQAILASNENAKKNHINQSQYEFLLSDQKPENLTVDLLVANILANPLMMLSKEISDYVKPCGKIALSGILSDQADAVIKAYQPYFDLNPIQQKEEWVLISGIKKS